MDDADNKRLAYYICRKRKKNNHKDSNEIFVAINELRKRLQNETSINECLLNLHYEDIFLVLTNEMLDNFILEDWINFIFKWIYFKPNRKTKDIIFQIFRDLPYKKISPEFIKEKLMTKSEFSFDQTITMYLYGILYLKLKGSNVSNEEIASFNEEAQMCFTDYDKTYYKYENDILNTKFKISSEEYIDLKKELDIHFAKTNQQALQQKINAQNNKKKTPLIYTEKFYAIADIYNSFTRENKNFSFNPYEIKISSIAWLKLPRRHSASVVVGKKIYIFNGYDRLNNSTKETDFVSSYDITKNQWDAMAFKSNTTQRYHSVVLNCPQNEHQAYQLGGKYSDGTIAADVKIYNFEKLEISTIDFELTNQGLYDTRRGLVKDKIFYLFQNKVNKGDTSRILCWDTRAPLSDLTQISAPNLDKLKPNYSVTSYENNIYVLGGEGKDGEILNEIISLDIRNKKYSSLPNMLTKRYNHSSFVYRGTIFVLGGTVDEEYDSTIIETYNIGTKEWGFCGNKIPYSLPSFAGAYYTPNN
uniref:BACK domain-containing protein n=1 Tax=Parastrongyloides trichosuri TaxID=131310 RepID=A0A0N4ZUZ8_PARTI